MKAKILPPTPENLELTARAIQKGEVVGMPTETVYGLAGDARSPSALLKIFETKERPTFDPLIIHVDSRNKDLRDLEKLCLVDSTRISDLIRKRANHLIHAFWPGPLTLVLPKHPDVPDLATSGLPSVALRMPRHPVAQALISQAQTPLAAPSANRFGRISPTTSQAVAEELGDRIHWILEGGPCEIGLESTVIRFTDDGKIQILRPGGISRESLEAVTGPNSVLPFQTSDPSIASQTPAIGPGMLESHYAPKKLLKLLPQPISQLTDEDIKLFFRDLFQNISPHLPIGLLLMSGDPEAIASRFFKRINRPVIARSLSLSGDLAEAARNFFSEMRWLDSSEATLILSEPSLDTSGLGYAIADRLKRASAKRA